jgi:hypothetical protein
LDADDSSSPDGARAVLAGTCLPGGMDATPGGGIPTLWPQAASTPPPRPRAAMARPRAATARPRAATAPLQLSRPWVLLVTPLRPRLVPLPLRTVRPRLLPVVPGAQPAAPPPQLLSSKHLSLTRMACAHAARMASDSC